MATEFSAKLAEYIIGYKFECKRRLLFQALTAAGAVEEYLQGNRRLALVGAELSEFMIAYVGFEADASRGTLPGRWRSRTDEIQDHTSQFQCNLSNKRQRAAVAEQTGLDACIKYNVRQAGKSATVLAKTVNALVAAVFLDCGGNILVVLRVMTRLGIFTQKEVTTFQPELREQNLLGFSDLSPVAEAILEKTANVESATSLEIQTLPPSPPAGAFEQGILEVLVERHDAEQSIDSEPILEFDSELPIIRNIPDHIQGAQLEVERQDASSSRTGGPSHQIVHKGVKRKSTHVNELPEPWQQLEPNSLQLKDKAFQRYLYEEYKKCKQTGHPFPHETFFSAAAQDTMLRIEKDKAEVLLKMLAYIASPNAIAAVREILNCSKPGEKDLVRHLRSTPSRRDRFDVIEGLERVISCSQLLRRHHILEFYKDCGGPATHFENEIIMVDPKSFGLSGNGPGNPKNKNIANVTDKMMEELFPDLEERSTEYQKKRQKLASIRRLGQRLHILENKFGQGILGLIHDHGSSGSLDVGISDNMILYPTIGAFQKFVEYLEDSQGDLLQEYSDAIAPMVRAVTAGATFDATQMALAGESNAIDFLQFPKYSWVLLNLLRNGH